MKVTHFTIEPIEGLYAVISHSTYPDYSILARLERRSIIRWFETVEDAQTEYPFAELTNHSIAQPIPDLPPLDFNEIDAGERWDNDY